MEEKKLGLHGHYTRASKPLATVMVSANAGRKLARYSVLCSSIRKCGDPVVIVSVVSVEPSTSRQFNEHHHHRIQYSCPSNKGQIPDWPCTGMISGDPCSATGMNLKYLPCC